MQKDHSHPHAKYTAAAGKFGDTIGFMDGDIEFNFSTNSIHELWWQSDRRLLKVLLQGTCIYSDDTIFLDMTTRVLNSPGMAKRQSLSIVDSLADVYVSYKSDPKWQDRAHGKGVQNALNPLIDNPKNWKNNRFPGASGCGSAMRTMPIGEALYGIENRQKLLEWPSPAVM